MSRGLRQAEVLQGLVEIRLESVDWSTAEAGLQVKWLSRPRAFAVVITQDCELEQDYTLRFTGEDAPDSEKAEGDGLQTIILCEAYPISQLKAVIGSGHGEKRALGNQYERFHCLEEGRPPGGDSLPGLVLDLRKTFSVPVVPLYDQLASEHTDAKRCGVIPPVHSHDLIHRYHTYQSRVAVPTEAQEAEERALLEAAEVEGTQKELARLSTTTGDAEARAGATPTS